MHDEAGTLILWVHVCLCVYTYICTHIHAQWWDYWIFTRVYFQLFKEMSTLCPVVAALPAVVCKFSLIPHACQHLLLFWRTAILTEMKRYLIVVKIHFFGHLYFLFWKLSDTVLCSFINWIYFFLEYIQIHTYIIHIFIHKYVGFRVIEKERWGMKERDRKRDIFQLFVHSTDGCNSRRPKHLDHHLLLFPKH